MTGLAVIILTHNEAIHIARAIASVRRIAQAIYVVDSGSTDDTVSLAEQAGARVLSHQWKNYAEQFAWATENIPQHHGWILRLDADEIVEPELATEIAARLPALPANVVGVYLKRKHVFLGRWIRFGGRYPLSLLRIFRRGHGRIEQRWMDEHIVVRGGETVTFVNSFADHNLRDLSYFVAKHNGYATREAIDVLNARRGFLPADAALLAGETSQAARKRLVKERFYNRLPFPIAAASYFALRYVLQGGFLDGRAGLVYHVLQGFWYRFLVGAKVDELERALAPLEDPAQIRAKLAELTGLQLD